MSLLNVLDALLDDYNRRHWDEFQGLALTPGEVLRLTHGSLPSRSVGQMQPWRNFAAGDIGVSSFKSNKNEFKINLDVQQFKPDELKIKVVDGYLCVDGKHEEKQDEHGFISRQFTRRYKIPEDVDQEKLSSCLSSDGVLSVSGPKIVKDEACGREIPIVRTNQPAVQQSSHQEEQKGEKKQEVQMES